MKPFESAHIPESEIEDSIRILRQRWEKDKLVSIHGRELSAEEFENTVVAVRTTRRKEKVFLNNLYQVMTTDHPELGLIELSIRRLDRQIIRNWRSLQQIKNMLVGPENEGFEIFPAESRLVDTANQYYMWVFKDPTYRFPFGFQERSVSALNLGKSRNKFIRDERKPSSEIPSPVPGS